MDRDFDKRTVIRKLWLDTVIADCQRVAGRCTAADRDEAPKILHEFALALPPAIGPLEQLLMRALLVDVAYQAGASMHERVHGGNIGTCAFAVAAFLNDFWTTDDAAAGFHKWRLTYFEALNATHPPSLGSSIGRLVKRDFQRSWDLVTIARRFNATISKVRRSFKNDFGMSVREYQRLLRLVSVLADVRREKIDALALRAGYRSRKNFYRAFAWLTGLTPSEYRRLSDEQALQIHEKASLKIVRHTHRGGNSTE